MDCHNLGHPNIWSYSLTEKNSNFWSALMAISTSFSMYVVLGIYNFANFLGLLPFSEALLLSNGTKQVVSQVLWGQ